MDEQQREKLSQVQKLRRGAVIIEQTQDQFRQDGYSNLLNKYGTAQDNSMAYSYEQEPVISDLELIRLYEGNGLFAKIIDRPSEESVKHGFDIDYGDEDIAEYVDDRLDELEFEDKFATAEKWARLYGGAIIVMLCDDGGGLEEPLDWNKVTTIEEMRVFERAIVQEDYTSLYHFHFFDSMKNKKPFGQPEYYHVYSTYGYFTVHYSRCLIFRNGRLPEQTTNSIYRYWGMPEYVKINRALRECVTSHEDGVKLLERSVQAIYKMKNLAQLLSTDSGEDKVLQRLQVIDMARGILNSIAIDTDGEDYDYKSLPLSGVKDVIDSTCNMLSAVTNIPQTILFGRSPAGMNATGESDLENYYNMVENIQKQNMKANARTVIDLILKQGLIEGKIPEIPKYKMKFAALWSMSEMEKADAAQKKAQTEQVKAQTAQVYIESGVLDPSEVRKSLANEGDFDIEEVISEDDLNLPEDTFAPKEAPEEKETDDFDLEIKSEAMNSDGGSGSGNWGHSGRPGKVGGSAGGGGKAYRQGTKESGFSSEAKKRAAEKKGTNGGGGSGEASKEEYAKALKESKTGAAAIDKYGDLWTKQGSDEWINHATGEIVGDTDATNLKCKPMKYNGSLESTNGYVSQSTMDDKLSEIARNQFEQEGSVSVSSDDLERMVGSIQKYGTAGDCQMILATQDPDHYGEVLRYMSETDKKTCAANAEDVERFIQLSDKYVGSIYRGIGLNTEMQGKDIVQKTLGELKEGQEISLGHIASWSSNKGTAEDYAGNVLDTYEYQEGLGDTYKILYRLGNNKTAVSLAGINPEGECLSPKAAKYMVKKVDTQYDEDFEICNYIVDLEEM